MYLMKDWIYPFTTPKNWLRQKILMKPNHLWKKNASGATPQAGRASKQTARKIRQVSFGRAGGNRTLSIPTPRVRTAVILRPAMVGGLPRAEPRGYRNMLFRLPERAHAARTGANALSLDPNPLEVGIFSDLRGWVILTPKQNPTHRHPGCLAAESTM